MLADRDRRRRAHAELRVLNARARRMSSARPVAKNGLRTGVVVWAHVPFAGESGNLRPAVVSARRGTTLLVRPITSRDHRLTYPGYVALRRWEDAGLGRRSAVKLLDIPIAMADVLCIVGALHPDDLVATVPCVCEPARVTAPLVSTVVPAAGGGVPVAAVGATV